VTPGAVHFAELTSPQVGELLAGDTAPVLLLPVGAVEPHGPHAPLATDSIISVAVCERTAHELASSGDARALVLPPIDYGVTQYSAAFPGAVSISADTLRSLVVEVCSALRDSGFRHRVIVNSHFEPEHVSALRDAAADSQSAFFDLTRRRIAERLTDEFRSGAAHAGRYETSIVLARRPALVDSERMHALPEIIIDMPMAITAGKTDFIAMGMHDAYCGAPSQSTAAEGETTLATLTGMLIELIREQIGR
jgi:creatinine amidohydrolase